MLGLQQRLHMVCLKVDLVNVDIPCSGCGHRAAEGEAEPWRYLEGRAVPCG